MNLKLNKLAETFLNNNEAALIKEPSNIFYFLGIDTHSAGTLLLLSDKSYFIIDSRYIEIARNNIEFTEVVLEKNSFVQICEILGKHGIKQLYIEDSAKISYAKSVKDAVSENVLIDSSNKLSNEILKLRMVKSEKEIETIRRAQKLTDECFKHILKFIKPGAREIDIALEMEMYMRKNGAKEVAFPTILVAGNKSSLPHGEPGENVIKDGDFVTLDFGAKVDGYCADMTRTVAISHVSKEQEDVYNTVLKAQIAACEHAHAGLRGCDVDKVARDIITQAGYGEYFGHGLGHSLGIDIHEDPRFSVACKTEIPENATMTIEPGIYLPGKFGVRIEDTVLVKKDCIEILAASDKNLLVL